MRSGPSAPPTTSRGHRRLEALPGIAATERTGPTVGDPDCGTQDANQGAVSGAPSYVRETLRSIP